MRNILLPSHANPDNITRKNMEKSHRLFDDSKYQMAKAHQNHSFESGLATLVFHYCLQLLDNPWQSQQCLAKHPGIQLEGFASIALWHGDSTESEEAPASGTWPSSGLITNSSSMVPWTTRRVCLHELFQWAKRCLLIFFDLQSTKAKQRVFLMVPGRQVGIV